MVTGAVAVIALPFVALSPADTVEVVEIVVGPEKLICAPVPSSCAVAVGELAPAVLTVTTFVR